MNHRWLWAILSSLIVWTSGCVVDAPYKVNHVFRPQQLSDGWTVTAPESSGLNMDSLRKVHAMLMDEGRFFNALGLLIVKDNRLVFEAYPRDLADRDRYHHVQSVTKSFTSMALGLLVGDGSIDSVDMLLHHFLPEKFPDDPLKKTITLRHLLTMTSGLTIDNRDFAYTMMVEKPADQSGYILNLPLYAAPGDSFYYRDCDPQLIGYVIQRVAGKTQKALVDERLFQPLGITDYYWESNPEGVTCAAHALHLKPRDMAKVGQMLLQNGRWNGAKILDSAWIAQSTTPMRQTVWEGVSWDYGFLWWIFPRFKSFAAAGHGGNYILVCREKNMVCVLVSMPDVDDEVVGTTPKRLLDELLLPLLGT